MEESKNRILNIGSKKQLFIDGKFFDLNDGVKLVLNPPVECGPVIKADRAWEERIIHGYSIVMENPLGDGVHRLYYICSPWPDPPPKGQGDFVNYTAVILSRDGVHWEKPSLGYHSFRGNRDNNICHVEDLNGNWVDCIMGGPFLDPVDEPERRFKSYSRLAGNLKLILAWSGDGFLWKTDGKYLNDAAVDGSEVVFWDKRTQRFVGYGRGNGRTITRLETECLTNWRRYEAKDVVIRSDYYDNYINKLDGPMLLSSEGISQIFGGRGFDPEDPGSPMATDNPDLLDGVDIYGPTVTRYPYADDVYLAAMPMFYHNPNLFEIQLAVSRDGIRWDRPGDRQPWGRLPLDDEGVHINYPGTGVLRDGNWIYHYRGHSFAWHQHTDPAHPERYVTQPLGGPYGGEIHLMKLRLDGYISVDAGNRECSFITPPLLFQGSRLYLNVDTSASGHLRAELMDASNPLPRGTPIRHFTLEDCERIVSNSCNRAVRWKETDNVSAWSGKPVRLRISMRNAKLYAFGFED